MFTYKILKWDSQFFRKRIAQVFVNELTQTDLNGISNRSKQDNVRLIYLICDSSDHKSVHLIDSRKDYGHFSQKVIFTQPIDGVDLSEEDSSVFIYNRKHPSKDLINLSLQSGHYSRFKLDDNFDPNDYFRLYSLWIRKSTNFKIADQVLVFREDNRELGFITVKNYSDYSEIGLIAVDSLSRGKNVGSRLISAVRTRTKQLSINQLKVATQGSNVAACNFYLKNNFEVFKRFNYYHVWL